MHTRPGRAIAGCGSGAGGRQRSLMLALLLPLVAGHAVAQSRRAATATTRPTRTTFATRLDGAVVARRVAADSVPRAGVAPPLHPPVDVVSATLVVAGTRKGFHVVRVAVPREYGADRPVSFVVVPTGDAPILGRRVGVIAPAVGRGVSLTVGVPTDARAGLAGIASVVFSAPGAPTIEVPIGIDVAHARRIELRLDAALVASRPGERTAIGYDLMNLGNAPDTVTVTLQAPQGWRVEGGDGMTFVRPGDVVHRVVHVTVPRGLVGGRFPVRLTASAAGAPVAATDVLVELAGTAGSGADANGTTLRVGAMATRGPWDGTALGATYALSGQLTDGVQLAASAVTVPSQGSASQLALARSGLAPIPASLTLTSRSWHLAAGPVGGTLTELTGTSVGGQGAALTVTRPRWNASALATRPISGASGAGTDAVHAQVGTTVGSARVFTAVSSLRESLGPLGAARQLDALSAGMEAGSLLDRRVASEVGYRRFQGGAGIGASAAASLRGERGSLDVRAAHAAGGTMAFARGTDELSLSGTRQLGSHLGLNASAWRLADDDRGARSLRTTGWSIGANSRLSTGLSASIGARSFGYASRAAAGTFGSADRSVFGTVQARLGPVNADVDGSLGLRTRGVSSGGAGGIAIEDRTIASRYGARVHMNGRAGMLAISGATSTAGAAVGFPSRQMDVSVSADQVPLLTRRQARLVLGGGASRVTSFVTPGAWITTLRGSLGAELPLGVTVSVEAERNPMYFANTLDAARAGQWMYVTRVERTLALPSFARGHRVEGLVFADTDGDGRRGRDEVGLRGIVVRRGGELSMTDRDGRYRFAGASSDQPAVDVRSLPMGLVAGGAAGARGGDLAVTALTALDVVLHAEAADSTRVTTEDLSKAIISVKDGSGRVWVARLLPGSGAGVTARFDALPPGTYELAADFSQGVEPLRIKGTLPTVSITAGARPPIHVTVQPRPLRFQGARPAGPELAPRVVGESTRSLEPRLERQRQ